MMQTDDTCDNDLNLCRLAAAGDERARRALYEAHADAVMTVSLRLLIDRTAAEDVLHDAFIKAFERGDTFQGRAQFRTWIKRIAVNLCLKRLRSPWHTRKESFEDAPTAPDFPDDQLDLGNALATLDPMSRAVVWLHDVEGYTHREIAAMMDRTVSFSKSRLARAHDALRRALTTERQPAGSLSSTRCVQPNDPFDAQPAINQPGNTRCTPLLKTY